MAALFDGDFFKGKYRIRSTRLQGWDYSENGYYFVTICVKHRACTFGEIKNGKILLSDLGVAARNCWCAIPDHFPFVRLDEYIIMPDHVHGIIVIDKPAACKGADGDSIVETHDYASLRASLRQNNNTGRKNQQQFGPQSRNLGSMIRGFKIGVKKWARSHAVSFEWQPRFYDRIIRDEIELRNVRNYIRTNHLKGGHQCRDA